jgi:hypothetical protein
MSYVTNDSVMKTFIVYEECNKMFKLITVICTLNDTSSQVNTSCQELLLLLIKLHMFSYIEVIMYQKHIGQGNMTVKG